MKVSSDYRWLIIPLIYVVILGGAALVGFVKFMAWWRVAFGDCHP